MSAFSWKYVSTKNDVWTKMTECVACLFPRCLKFKVFLYVHTKSDGATQLHSVNVETPFNLQGDLMNGAA